MGSTFVQMIPVSHTALNATVALYVLMTVDPSMETNKTMDTDLFYKLYKKLSISCTDLSRQVSHVVI